MLPTAGELRIAFCSQTRVHAKKLREFGHVHMAAVSRVSVISMISEEGRRWIGTSGKRRVGRRNNGEILSRQVVCNSSDSRSTPLSPGTDARTFLGHSRALSKTYKSVKDLGMCRLSPDLRSCLPYEISERHSLSESREDRDEL